MQVLRSEDEEHKYIHVEEDNFVACFAFGEWFDRKVIDIAHLKELDLDDEMYDVAMIVRQARKALRSC